MESHSARPETPLVAHAIAAVRELVALPAYASGARLPSETEIAGRLGISRPVVRQALAVLKTEGLIESRKGSGTYATGLRSSVLTYGQLESLSDLEDCMRFRMVIESAAAGEAARRGDAAAVEGIRRALQAMEQDGSTHTHVLARDMDFHLAIARATRSRYYVMTLETLLPHIIFGLNVARQLRNIPATITSKRVISEHRAVFTAIENGNVEEASDAMREHIREGIERIFGDRSW